MSLDSAAADAAIDAYIAAMPIASADPTALRDAMRPLARALYAGIQARGNHAIGDVETDVATSSSTYNGLTGAIITTTAPSSSLDITFTASGAHLTNPGTTYFMIYVNGVAKKGTQFTQATAAAVGFSVATSMRVPVTAGTHIIDVRWKTDNVSARINGASMAEEHGHLLVEERL